MIRQIAPWPAGNRHIGATIWALQRIPAEPTFPKGFAVATAAMLAGAKGKICNRQIG